MQALFLMQADNPQVGASATTAKNKTPTTPTTIANADVGRGVKVVAERYNSRTSLRKLPARLWMDTTALNENDLLYLTRKLRASRISARVERWILTDDSSSPICEMVRIQPASLLPSVFPQGGDTALDEPPAAQEEPPTGKITPSLKQLSIWTTETTVAVKGAKYGCTSYLVMGYSRKAFRPLPLEQSQSRSFVKSRSAAEGTHLVLLNDNSGINNYGWLHEVFDAVSESVERAKKIRFISTYALYKLLHNPRLLPPIEANVVSTPSSPPAEPRPKKERRSQAVLQALKTVNLR